MMFSETFETRLTSLAEHTEEHSYRNFTQGLLLVQVLALEIITNMCVNTTLGLPLTGANIFVFQLRLVMLKHFSWTGVKIWSFESSTNKWNLHGDYTSSYRGLRLLIIWSKEHKGLFCSSLTCKINSKLYCIRISKLFSGTVPWNWLWISKIITFNLSVK